MRIFSTFSGVGGFEIGIQNAYRSKNRKQQKNTQRVSPETRQGLHATQGQSPSSKSGRSSAGSEDSTFEGPLFVGYSEIDKYAIQVYERNFPNAKNYGDITKINAEELPEFDIFVGGFPCQAFSIAGKRRGFEDTRGTLFFDIARILQTKRPRLIVLENVKGLLSHDNGGTFKTIISTLTELGYDLQWQVLNSKNFGVPQNRERIIIVGHLRGTPRPEVFPITGSAGGNLEEITHNVSDAQRIYESTGIAKSQKALGGGLGAKTGLYCVGNTNPSGRGMNGNVYYSDGISPTLSTNKGEGTKITDGFQVRRLTPLECERLQSFPDNWTKFGEDEHGVRVPISDSQRYKMMGNAVTTNVIQAVFERLLA